MAAGALGLGFNIATDSGWFQNFQSWGHWYLSQKSHIIREHILLDWQVVAGIDELTCSLHQTPGDFLHFSLLRWLLDPPTILLKRYNGELSVPFLFPIIQQ